MYILVLIYTVGIIDVIQSQSYIKTIESQQFITEFGIKSSQSIRIAIDLSQYEFNREIIFYNEYVLPANSETHVFIEGFKPNYLAFGVFQLHSCMQNVTLWTDVERQKHYYGSNLGTIIHPSGSGRQTFRIENDNRVLSINVSLAVVAYSMFNPVPGGCFAVSPDDGDDGGGYPMLDVCHHDRQLIFVKTPTAADGIDHCDSPTKLSYSGFYLSLQRNDFTCRTYFDAVKKMMTTKGIRRYGKLVSIYGRTFTR